MHRAGRGPLTDLALAFAASSLMLRPCRASAKSSISAARAFSARARCCFR